MLKLISHPKRLAILCFLNKGHKSVGSIVEATEISQSQTSQFLAQMKEEWLLWSKREGRSIEYYIVDERILELMKSLKDIFCK